MRTLASWTAAEQVHIKAVMILCVQLLLGQLQNRSVSNNIESADKDLKISIHFDFCTMI